MLFSMGCSTMKYAGEDVKQKDAGEAMMEPYASLLNKVWIVDRPERIPGYAFEFILTKAEDNEIEGIQKFYILEDKEELIMYYQRFVWRKIGTKMPCILVKLEKRL